MRKAYCLLALGCLLAAAALPAAAQGPAADVAYDDAMVCGSLATVLSASIEGEPETRALDTLAQRWVVIAMRRDGTGDGSKALAELEAYALELVEEIEGYGDDQAALDRFLDEGIAFCEKLKDRVAPEFDSIEIED